jgi:hypothetical protein
MTDKDMERIERKKEKKNVIKKIIKNGKKHLKDYQTKHITSK